MIPDGEAILGRYLRQHHAVKALEAAVVSETPSDTSAPWVRIALVDDPPVGGHRFDHLIRWRGDFHCYAGAKGGQGEASLLRRTVRAALRDAPAASHDGAVVTGVDFITGPRLPDSDDFEPARQRYILTATVWMHP